MASIGNCFVRLCRCLCSRLGLTRAVFIPALAIQLATVSGKGICGSSYQYDAANNLVSRTENGHTTRFGNYDTRGQFGCKVDGIGAADASVGECAFDPAASPDARRTDYSYDARFFDKVTSITEPSVFPGSNKVTTYGYDDFGNRTSQTIDGFDPAGNPVTRTTTWRYEGPLRQLSRIDGPRTDVSDITRYRYYANDAEQGSNRARLKEIENANGVLLRFAIQYTATGKVASERRPNGLLLTYSYYAGNDRLKTLAEAGPSGTRVTRWTYLATGEVESITTGYGTADATTLTFAYDDAGRLTRVTDGLGNYVQYTLDTEGNRKEEKSFDVSNSLSKGLNQTFDAYNRLAAASQANEVLSFNFAPDGTLDVQTDGKGSVTDYSYDDLNRLTQVVQDQGGSDGATADTATAYAYDVADRLTSVSDPVGGNTSYAYDDLGNLVSQTSPDAGSTAFEYDAAGNLIRKTDANGQLFLYSYDALNRLTSIDAPGTADDIRYYHDTCVGGLGRVCTVVYGDGRFPAGNRVHYRYNAFGDSISQSGLLYDYDTQGRLRTIEYPSGSRLGYLYDAAGQVNRVEFTVNGQTRTLAEGLIYAPFGPNTGLIYGNGLVLTQTFDSAYRMTGQWITGVLERSYSAYDANGNRTRQTEAQASPSSFSYDKLNRLEAATGPFGSREYAYDRNGNRTQLTAGSVITSSSYQPNSNRLATLAASDVILDANGNMLSRGNWTYRYTPHNRLRIATDSSTLKASFSYNALGQRIGKIDHAGNAGRHFLYGSGGELLAESDAEGNILKEYLYLNGQLLAVYSPDDDGDGISNAQEAIAGTLPVDSDSDGDGLSNLGEWFQHGTDSATPDSDGDGVGDGVEIQRGTDPLQAASYPGDGDINQNGQINLGDLVLLYQYVLGNRTPTAIELTHADMNRDGQLTIQDILLLQQRLLTAWLGLTVAVNQTEQVWSLAQGRRIGRPAEKPEFHHFAWFIKSAEAVPTGIGQLYYVHNDPLGIPQVLTDESGAIVWKAVYDPFGYATVEQDPDGNGMPVTLNIRFPGQYYDAETGLHYNYFRYYDPNIGRYLTADPTGLDAGPNPYTYADGNPINWFDPKGLEPRGRNKAGSSGGGSGSKMYLSLGLCGSTPMQRLLIIDGQFGPACLQHDRCYQCGDSKAQCDLEFLRHLRLICNKLQDPQVRARCQNRASNFFSAVDYFGHDAWARAQRNKSLCGC